MSEILFSLAETHSDKEEYDSALDYHMKELLIWSDHPNEVPVLGVYGSVCLIVTGY